MTIEEIIKSGKAHVISADRLRRMFYDNGEWEVWGQVRKYDRTHLIEKGNLDYCIKALIGESQANAVANEPPLIANQ